MGHSILSCGENVLCNICKDHPRFRNFRSDRTEVGLGLACEEACRLILNYNEPFCLVGDFIPSDEVDELIEFVKKELYTGHIGDGKIFVSPISNVIRVRTGEEGLEALK